MSGASGIFKFLVSIWNAELVTPLENRTYPLWWISTHMWVIECIALMMKLSVIRTLEYTPYCVCWYSIRACARCQNLKKQFIPNALGTKVFHETFCAFLSLQDHHLIFISVGLCVQLDLFKTWTNQSERSNKGLFLSPQPKTKTKTKKEGYIWEDLRIEWRLLFVLLDSKQIAVQTDRVLLSCVWFK